MSDDEFGPDNNDDSEDEHELVRAKRTKERLMHGAMEDTKEVTCYKCGQTTEYDKYAFQCEGATFHRRCFACEVCARVLDMGNYVGFKGRLFCRPHYEQKIKIGGGIDQAMYENEEEYYEE